MKGSLPSLPLSIIDDDKHFAAFTRMGLSKLEMATLVVGSTALVAFRLPNSPGLAASCPFVPFDCTPAHQISGADGPLTTQCSK